MPMLHIVNKSPFERNALDSCLRLATPGSAVLLIEDGVYAAVAGATHANKITSRMNELSFFALRPDVNARGLADIAMIDGIDFVDYEGFVDLVAEYDASQSWL